MSHSPGATPVGVLVSGAGTNLGALLDAAALPAYPARVAVVISNRPSSGALVLAATRGVDAVALPLSRFDGDRAARDAAIRDALLAARVRLVVCAGYDAILGDAVLDAFPGAILNIHPSLLPAFGGGMHAVEDALDAGVKVTGCTVHFVEPGAADTGAIVLQEAVEVRDGDDAEVLRARIHAAEWRILPRAVALWCEGRLVREGRRVRIAAQRAGAGVPAPGGPAAG